MKFIVFYEGESERMMFDQLLSRRYQPACITEDLKEFINTPDDENCVLHFPCGNDHSVLINIEEYHWLYERGEIILAVRDLESVPCYSGMKDELTQFCTALPPVDRIKLIFSKPEFERIYFSDLNIFERVFHRIYSQRGGVYVPQLKRQPPDLTELSNKISGLDPTRPEASIKALFREYNMAYRKPEFAELYFAQFDFYSSTDPYIQRVVAAFGELTRMPS